MKIVIAGGSGFVGKAVSDFFQKNGDEVYILTRTPQSSTNLKYIEWLSEQSHPITQLDGVDYIINLAGESINSGRWDDQRKSRILQSRLNATNELLDLISKLKEKPKALINASAIGFYGTSEITTFTEENKTAGKDFLAQTVQQWENIAIKAEAQNVRTILCRFGIILAKNGGALPKMALPYRLFAGGKLGKGSQWVSWIHIEDIVRAISFVMENDSIQGPVNFISPNPVQMNHFGELLGQVLRRPHWIPSPEIALKLLLGEMSMLMLEGQKVLPEKLLKHGFTFHYPSLEEALKNIFKN